MNAQFFDRQDFQNPRNGRKVSESNEIDSWIDEMLGRPAFFCELVGENGFNLLIGLGRLQGCAQYSASDGSPPYSMAIAEETESEEFMEFLISNTDTPVAMKFCLSIECVKKIVADYLATGKRSPLFSWEEI